MGRSLGSGKEKIERSTILGCIFCVIVVLNIGTLFIINIDIDITIGYYNSILYCSTIWMASVKPAAARLKLAVRARAGA